MKVTFLGTGTSCGVPTIGCGCEVCTSTDPRDRRTRCSALVETASTRILIDCGPDFRQQILPLPFGKIDGILVTHSHYDHVGGIDDVRPFCKFGDVNVYADRLAADNLRHTIPYCFAEIKYPGVPEIRLNTLTAHTPVTIGDINVMPVEVWHDKLPILGYRLNDFVYITDMKTIRATELPYLTDAKVLAVNALRFNRPHHSHQLVADAVRFSRSIGARRTLLIHASHDIGKHTDVNAQLPEGIEMAYDGQTITV